MDCTLLQQLYFLLFNYTMTEYQKLASGGKGCQLVERLIP
jgi:hypothetical protein